MNQTKATSFRRKQPISDLMYPRSWIDSLTQWIDRIPGPNWLFYLLAYISIAFLNNAIRWLDGSLEVGSFILIRVLDTGYLVLVLALYHYLSQVAGSSFQVFKQVIKSSEQDLNSLRLRITTMPRWFGWLAIIGGLGLTILGVQNEAEAFGIDVLMTVPAKVYQYIAIFLAFACMVAVGIQTVRQLRLVYKLHQGATEINLFRLEPAHAFSSLTARTGIGLIIFILYSALVESSNITDSNLAGLVIAGILAVVVFTLPLMGMRNRLKAEKARLISEINERIQVTIDRIHNQVDTNSHENIENLKNAMEALIDERQLIEGISTWPWEASTLRGFASTLLLPIFLWLVTRLLERVF